MYVRTVEVADVVIAIGVRAHKGWKPEDGLHKLKWAHGKMIGRWTAKGFNQAVLRRLVKKQGHVYDKHISLQERNAHEQSTERRCG